MAGSVASEHPRTCCVRSVDVLVHSFECCDPKPRLLLTECHALALLGLDGAASALVARRSALAAKISAQAEMEVVATSATRKQ